MKKTYLHPRTVVHSLCTASILALSGNLKEGETTDVEVHDDVVIDGTNAWAKGNTINWEDDWSDDSSL